MKLLSNSHYVFLTLAICHCAALAKDVLDFPIELDAEGAPCVVRISTIEGDVKVVGHDGENIELRAKGDFDEDGPRFMSKGWSVTQDGNRVAIKFGPLSDLDFLSLKVPYKANVKVGVVDGDVEIGNLSAGFEISSKDGDLDMRDVSGSVIANTVDGDVFLQLASGEEGEYFISLSTLDGDIKLVAPQDIQATVSANTFDGDVDIEEAFLKAPLAPEKPKAPIKPRASTKAASKPKSLGSVFRSSNAVSGLEINGGGGIIELSTVDGDIDMRASGSRW